MSEGLHCGDCIELMANIENESIDMIICDLPYGTTANEWDIVIPYNLLWDQYNRIIKNNGAIVLTGMGMFSAMLMTSNIKMYRYSLIWEKSKIIGFLNSNRMPMRCHEDILVFYKALPTFNPQKTPGKPYKRPPFTKATTNYNKVDRVETINTNGDRNPTSIIKINNENYTFHPTQKPVALIEYLIKTYSNEGDTILDNCMGSGTAGVASKNLNRKFIGIEKNPEYYNEAVKRITYSPNLLFAL